MLTVINRLSDRRLLFNLTVSAAVVVNVDEAVFLFYILFIFVFKFINERL